jgi:hypothetical protein
MNTTIIDSVFFDALQKANVPCQFVLVPEGQHGPWVQVEKYLNMMVDFLLKNRKKGKII